MHMCMCIWHLTKYFTVWITNFVHWLGVDEDSMVTHSNNEHTG